MNDGEKITVLFVNPSTGRSGDTLSLGNLIESLRDEIIPIVLLMSKESSSFEFFHSLGVECIIHPYQILLEPPFWEKTKSVLFHPWRLRFIKWLRHDLPCIRYVIKALKGRHVDIIHSNRSQVLVGYYLAKILKVPHVWHVRDFSRYGERRVFGGLPRLKRRLDSADARIFVSDQCLRDWGSKKNNTWTIFDAVRNIDDCCFEKPKKPYLLFLSHQIYEAKGPRRAIDAYGKSKLFTNQVPIGLKIVGNCNDRYKKELIALADVYGCAEFIEFVPEQKDVKQFFAQALAFINPSINEGMGRTTAEAMFFGCPVIVHASGGSLELVKNGVTGYLYNTVEECAELMKKVCTTDQEEIILQAQAFVKQNLSIDGYGEKIMGVYKTVLNNYCCSGEGGFK